MKKIVIRTVRPGAFRSMATRLQKLFPECEVCISEFCHDANDPSQANDASQDDGLIDKHAFQDKGANDGKNSNRR